MDTKIKKYAVIVENERVFETYAVSTNDVMLLYAKELKRTGKILLEKATVMPVED